MFTAEALIDAIDKKRLTLAVEGGFVEPISYSEIARELGFHSALFSRLRQGALPVKKSVDALLEWLGDDFCVPCESEGEELETEVEDVAVEEVEDDLDKQLESLLQASETSEELNTAVEEAIEEGSQVNAVFAVGALSNSDDPETQAAISRVRELLNEGAIGVSVALDIHPDDMKIIAEAEYDEQTGEPKLPEGFTPRQRIRHTAIVDTPAFADARLKELEDGSLEGDITFEGVYTGDGRTVDLNSIALEDSNLPSPIIWDRHDGDHSGMTVGYITSWERKEDVGNTSARTVLDDEAITASIAPMELPARYFARTVPTKAEPMRISKPDAQGYRAIRGLAAPNGVCIRQSMQCWTWPGDRDKSHKHFHTGTLLHLDDGSDIRVGALTMGGAHLDGALAKQGVSARDASNHRDNANRVFALVNVWESRFGLMMAGVIPPDVTEADVARALACSPSIEFWPDNGGRTLIGLHLVPTPALPVLASSGSAEHFVTDFKIELEDEVPGEPTADGDDTPDEEIDAPLRERLSDIEDKIDQVIETQKAILALIPIDSVEIPE